MHPQATLPPDQLQKHSATRKVQFLKALKRLEFSGKLVWADAAGRQWVLFLNLGQIIYATGGIHSTRRWRRHLSAWYPHLKLDAKTLEQELSKAGHSVPVNCWEYHLLYAWLKQQRITEHNLSQIIQHIVVEVLFDIAQATDVTYQLQPAQPLASNCSPIPLNNEEIFTAVQKLWHSWFNSDLEGYFPNLAPSIQEAERIQAATSAQTYRTLTALLTGQYSLWDLAVKTQRDVLQLTQALRPYIQLGWVSLVEIADVSPPVITRSPRVSDPDPPLVACIDDSLTICRAMEQVIKGAGYQFVSVMEPSRAIATLLAKKPDIIFLDLIMPEASGYDICSYLRKLSLFKETPIIILSGIDGIVDQVRARLMGASDFLSKPMQPEVVLSIIRKHLGQAALR